MRIDHSIFSDKGGRQVNEDRADAVCIGSRSLFILCDGLGGHSSGSVAAETVTGCLKDYFKSCPGIDAFAADALVRAQSALKKVQQSDGRLREMRTTAVLLCIEGSRGIVLHIGDSRLYRFRNGRVLSRTRDHSLPQALCLAGEITEPEIRTHPDRNKLLRALGDEADEVRSERSDIEIMPGDSFLLCSDGLWEPVTEGEMERLLSETGKPKKWLSQLAKLAEKNSRGRNMDNYTAIAVTVRE